MQKTSLFLCFLFACAYTTPAQAQKDKLERLMNYYTTHDNFNGTVLIVKKGAVLMAKGYGYHDAYNKLKNDENTIFQLGSNTSQFTAEVILQLDSKGKLSLEDKVARYLPDYPDGNKISLKNLLTHTSGIYNYTSDIRSVSQPMSKEQVVAIFKNKPLAFEPGTRYAYSNSDYFLLGMIIEKITKKKYEHEVRESILNVCGMSRSGFDFAHLRNADKATGYNYAGGNKYSDVAITDSTISYASGALYSTAGDLLKWHRALARHRLLPKDWQDIAYTPFKNQYALGWSIDNMFNKRFYGHAGQITGFSNYEIRQEDDDLFVVLLENCTRPGATDEEIARNIVQCLYNKNYQLPGERREPAINKEPPINNDQPENSSQPAKKDNPLKITQLKKYVGTFEITPAFTLTFSINGNELVGASPNQALIKMIPESETLFRIAGMNDEIEFVRERNGKFDRIVLHQKGELIPGERSR